jgi:peptidoglycan/xylan/chitin deacetylase (PgdA/CDA1 family)
MGSLEDHYSAANPLCAELRIACIIVKSCLPILTFHDFADDRAAISFPAQLLRRALARVQANGYRTLPLAEVKPLLAHRQPLPDRAVVITFDDGYQSVYEQALPILQEFGMCATVFLTTGSPDRAATNDQARSLDGRKLLNWNQVDEMSRFGVAFGAHTLTHPDLTCLSGEKAEHEIVASKAALEEALGATVTTFAYPFGRYNARVEEIVRRHFDLACSDKLGIVSAGSNPYTLERVDAHYLRSERLFDWMPTRKFHWYVSLRAVPRVARRAVRERLQRGMRGRRLSRIANESGANRNG